MTDSPVDSVETNRSGTAAFLDVLNIVQNAKIAAVLGVGFGALVYVIRVFELLGPAPDTGGPILFLALAFVLAFGTFVLVTTVLTLVSAYRAVKREDL